jgi:colanic acid biosynthesis protein WcaH
MISQEFYTEIKRTFPLNAVEFVILNKEKKVLLVRRTNEPAKGQWWLPGGRVRFAESRLNAAKRLLQEECGISTELISLKGMFDYMVKNELENYYQHTITTVYWVQVDVDSIKTDSQSSEYSWEYPENWITLVEHDFLKHLFSTNLKTCSINFFSTKNLSFAKGFIRNELYNIILESLPIPCVDLLIKNKKDEILLVKRKNEPAKDEWWVPGGRVLYGENRENAAKRKLYEECFLTSENIRQVESFEFIFKGSANKTYHNIATMFEVTVDNADQQVALDEQSTEYSWKTAAEWLEMPLSEFMRDVLENKTNKETANKIYS